MLVLHGFWSPERGLCVWAEDSDRAVTSRSQALRSARPHPFAAPVDVLADVCSGKAGEATLRLPSLAKSPLDSPELIRVTPRAARSEAVLLSWRVPTIELDPAGALAWLATVADGGADGIRCGASLRYLAGLAAFAGELVERGRVLPTVVRDETGPLACWRPAVRGPDVVAFGALVTAMPPVCRAELGREDAHDLVADALHVLTDAAARDRLGPGVDLVPPRRGRRPRRVPAVEAWLAALTAADGRFDADDDELSALERELRPWAEIGTGRVGPARATFRLSEVEPQSRSDESAGWRLEFLLQSTQDPSLLVPAAQAWSDDGSLRRWLDRPHELLLAELGRASRIYPELAAGLRQATPCALDLDADGAHRFLAVVAPALDEAGFGVLLPSWWDRRARLGLKASASTPTDGVVAGGHFGRESLMDFRWQLAVGDDTLTDDEIVALAETKAPLVRLRGQWVAVDPEQLRRGLEFLRRGAG